MAYSSSASPYRVLFLCTGNSARSILGEALLNHLGAGRFRAYSAGSQPTGAVNPHALALLEEYGIATTGLHSKSWSEFLAPQAPPLDLIITVCDSAANEVCPAWPGRPLTEHWGLPDPAAVTGNSEQIRQAFRDIAETLEERIRQLLTQRPHAYLLADTYAPAG